MKHTKVIEIPATTQEVVDFVTCDLCGQVIEEKLYEVDEVTIKHTEGWSYPDGGYGTTYTLDMCGFCFRENLVPYLKDQGAVLIESDWE